MWSRGAATSRQVWLGTKPVQGRLVGCLARHWAIRVGENFWCEVDGLSGADQVQGSAGNTINGGSRGWWGWGAGPSGEHRGEQARSGTPATTLLGETGKTDQEIKAFNREYLANNPQYRVANNNCQDYVYALVNFLMGDTSRLPYKQMGLVGPLVGGVVGGLGLTSASVASAL